MKMNRLMALCALVSSAALAQQQPGDGNVPAPDLFDSQIVCTSQLPSMPPTPTVVAMDEMESALDTAIGMGITQITNPTTLTALGYVVPPMGSNCGQGAGEAAFTVSGQGDIATDIAKGYSEVLPKFMAVYGDPGDASDSGTAGALQRARTVLENAEADDTTSATRLRILRDALEDAQEADMEARAEFDAIAAGPIYQAGVAEWMAQSAVTNAVADYNDAVQDANDAGSVLNSMNYNGYVPLGNSELVQTVVLNIDGMGLVNVAALRNYTNADGDQQASTNSNGVNDVSQSNFDASGNLVVPNRRDGDDLVAATTSREVGDARDDADDRRVALEALKEYQAENRNRLLQPLIDEAVRRAQLEADYYDRQLRNALADDTNQNPITVDNLSTPEDESAPYSIASRNRDFVGASNDRAAAEAELRAKVAAREAATQNVIANFQNPDSFYSQLVARRQALKFFADQALADAGSSPSMRLTDAATAAAEALTEAEEAQAAYLALVDDPDDPVVGLIGTLLETDGDDGQAVVDAISGTYDKTVENRDAIAALTADTDDGAEADGPIAANRKAIEANDGEIEALDGRVSQNETDIDALQEDTQMNTGMIATNAGNIASNASNIAVNASNIVDNRSYIGQNAATLVNHGARIDRNASHIALNSERIGANAAAITMNSGLISDNRHMIGELSSDLEIVRAGVAASIALSRMPSVDGGGISFGAGTYAGEMAYAVGFQVERGFGTFDIGVTSSGGEIGAGVGVGLKVWH